MLFDAITTLFMYFAISTTVNCRDMGKSFKTIPTITNSLVNLGKMDVSIYLNARDSPIKSDGYSAPSSTYLYSKSEPIEEPCPCSSLRGYKDPFSHNPADFLNKILMSNDLFSYKEPTSSTLCCDSHEHDDFVTIDLGNKHNQIKSNPMQSYFGGMPLIIDSLITKKTPSSSLPKTKAVEIFLFPKKRESFFIPAKNNAFKKEYIQAVGGKELKKDFAFNILKPTTSVSSVKKDLTAQEKNEIKNADDLEDIQVITSATNSNAL